MEINKYRDISGVVAYEDIVEGRMVLKNGQASSHDYGSRTDLATVKLPDTSAEATKARYCVTFAVDNAEPPLYQPYPSFSFALRQGFDQDANVPFSATVRLTQPSMQEGQTIPSGALALAFGPGEFTVPSGAYVYSSDVETPGTFLTVANTADDSEADAGKLKYDAGAASPIEVVRYDSATGKLTFRILY